MRSYVGSMKTLPPPLSVKTTHHTTPHHTTPHHTTPHHTTPHHTTPHHTTPHHTTGPCPVPRPHRGRARYRAPHSVEEAEEEDRPPREGHCAEGPAHAQGEGGPAEPAQRVAEAGACAPGLQEGRGRSGPRRARSSPSCEGDQVRGRCVKAGMFGVPPRPTSIVVDTRADSHLLFFSYRLPPSVRGDGRQHKRSITSLVARFEPNLANWLLFAQKNNIQTTTTTTTKRNQIWKEKENTKKYIQKKQYAHPPPPPASHHPSCLYHLPALCSFASFYPPLPFLPTSFLPPPPPLLPSLTHPHTLQKTRVQHSHRPSTPLEQHTKTHTHKTNYSQNQKKTRQSTHPQQATPRPAQ